jgi:hypothetical protein
MRRGIGAVIVVLLAGAPAGAAEFGTVFVVPGRPGVPVVINGWDASFTVVEGEFGLDRPSQVNPVIVGNPLVAPAPLHYGPYFPRFGRKPGYGRLEVEPPPNRRQPPPAQRYHRSWSSQSEPLPATTDPPASPLNVEVDVNGDPYANRDDRDHRRRRDSHRHRRHHGGGRHR